MEYIVYDKDNSDKKDKNEDDDNKDTETESEDDDETPPKVWYFKLKYLIDHVRDASMSLIWIVGMCLALDEMMVRFLGRPMEKHCIKDKPIGEGYKLFTLSTMFGYIVNFTPDGITTAKSQQQEYKTVHSVGKIESMILHVVSIISHLHDKQKSRNASLKSSRSMVKERNEDTPMENFVLAMDNYFTLPRVIHAFREMGIGVVGTSHFRKRWPPKNLCAVTQQQAKFNDFYWCIDGYGMLLGRWLDNILVFCIRMVHKVDGMVERARRRPRITILNKNHVKDVWGDVGKKEINIPKLINGYNHWMGGVD
eukprot:15347574-Ditylum_brightwellii.AAC.1